ncbi:hypothetical protein TRFO_31699 [Tritrichomonas foetus]|uniref:Uncharacterized protein n=1 Tax=Tritrichomonas foetus TaxID=1144522 RepID=A0A1J4JSR3_9EUKA|nr:hypothetical protein TRFO_31699 [Tritrichomonas foetus]|eukprot:OHT01472.1 hypothetical protein TRFO_31699 [Tritrichomonas foetus]
MTDPQAPAATISIPFIFLKLKGVKNVPIKKIIFPRTFSLLLKTAKTVFDSIIDVQTLFDEQGNQLTTIEQVVPGSTIYVSSLSANEYEPATKKKPTQTPTKNSKGIMSKDSFNRLFGQKDLNDIQPGDDQANAQVNLYDPEQNMSEHSNKPRTRFTPRSERMRAEEEKKKKTSKIPSRSNISDASSPATGGAREAAKVFQRGAFISASEEEEPTPEEPVKKPKKQLSSKPQSELPEPENSPEKKDLLTFPSPSKNNDSTVNDSAVNDSTVNDSAVNDSAVNDNESQSSISHSRQRKARRDDAPKSAQEQFDEEIASANDSQLDFSANENEDSNTPRRRRKRASQIPMNKSPAHSQISAASSVSGKKSITMVINQNKPTLTESSSVISAADSQHEQEDFSDIDEDYRDLQEVIDETVEPGALQGVLGESLEQIPECADSLTKLPDLEKQQIYHWYNKATSFAEQQNIAPLPENAVGVDEMIAKVRCMIMDHRLVSQGGVSHRINIGIIGPQQSGKSVFLRVFTEEYLTDLVATGQWKDTFIFVLDLCNIISYTSNFIQFYHAIVSLTIQSLYWQCPYLSEYIPMIQKMFEDVTKFTSPPKFGKTFMLNPYTQRIAAELQVILNKLSILWNDEEALTEWVTSAVYFPMIISRALGFKQCTYILDHFDIADVELNPSPSKFSESVSSVFLIDILNFALVHCNFIVACSSQQDFLRAISKVPGDELGKAQFDLVSTIGLIQEKTYQDKQIKVSFSDDTFPTSFTCEICGGIPLYQHVWNAINEILDEIENDEENAEELNETLNAQVQTAMKYFFADEDGQQRIHEVTLVTRKVLDNKQ